MSFQKLSVALALVSFSTMALFGCGSSVVKQRKEQREKLSQSAKLYCEFINGDMYPNDIDVAMNIEMAKRCDSEKPYSMTQYKTPSESQGIVYCCSLAGPKEAKKEVVRETPKESQPEAVKESPKEAAPVAAPAPAAKPAAAKPAPKKESAPAPAAAPAPSNSPGLDDGEG